MYTCHQDILTLQYLDVTVWKYSVFADILQISKTWLSTVHLMTLPKRSLRALNFVPSKSYFRYSKAVLRVYIFRHYPGMNVIDQSCTAQIFFYHQNNLQVSVLFVYDVHQTCQSNQIPVVECDNLIGPII